MHGKRPLPRRPALPIIRVMLVDDPIPRDRARVYQLVAFLLLLAAGFGTYMALGAYYLLCDQGCSGRSWELEAQLFLAIAGLVTAGVMTGFALVERWGVARLLLVISLGLYGAWGVLLVALPEVN